MMYDIIVSIHNSPTKITGWGYLIKANSPEDAVELAFDYARRKADRRYSRYKRCTFSVEPEDVRPLPNW